MAVEEYMAAHADEDRHVECLWRADEGLYIAVDRDTREVLGHVIPRGSDPRLAEFRPATPPAEGDKEE